MSQTNFALPAHLSSSFDQIKRSQTLPNPTSNSYTLVGDIMPNATSVEKELECQICLSKLETPILLACNAHSLCYDCITSLFEHQKKVRGGKRHVFCPTCGHDSGSISSKKAEDFRVNKELERVMLAYEKEKSMWFEEKFNLQQQLYGLMNIPIEPKKAESNKGKKNGKKEKDNLQAEEEECLKDIIEGFGAKKLKQVEQLIMETLKAKENQVSKPKVQRKNTKSSKASEKGKNNKEVANESENEEEDKRETRQSSKNKQTNILSFVGSSTNVKRGRPSKKTTMKDEQKDNDGISLRITMRRMKTT